MRFLVTGTASFIGSQLCKRFLDEGPAVADPDTFISYTPRAKRESNLRRPRGHSSIRFHPLDLRMDQRHTFAGISRFYDHSGLQPRGDIDQGLTRQVNWQKGALRRQAT